MRIMIKIAVPAASALSRLDAGKGRYYIRSSKFTHYITCNKEARAVHVCYKACNFIICQGPLL